MDQVWAYGDGTTYGDQYSPETSVGWRDLLPSRVKSSHGFVEDVYRLNQYGVPADLQCRNPSPEVGLREPRMPACVSRARDESSHYTNLNTPLGAETVNVRATTAPPTSCCGGKENFEVSKEDGKYKIEIDSNTLFMIFVFVVLLCISMYACKTISEMKETLKNLQSRMTGQVQL